MNISSCHICRRWLLGLRSDITGGQTICGPCRDLRSIGNLIASESFIEEDGPVIWQSIIGLEDHLRNLERQRRIEEAALPRQEGEKDTKKDQQSRDTVPEERSSPQDPVEEDSDEYTYSYGSEEEAKETKGDSSEEGPLPGVSPKVAVRRPPSPPAPRKSVRSEKEDRTEQRAKKHRAGGGKKRKLWLQRKIDKRREEKAQKRNAKGSKETRSR